MKLYGHLLIRFKTNDGLGTDLTYKAAEEVKDAISRTIDNLQFELDSVGLSVEVIDMDEYGLSQNTFRELESMEPK